MVPRISASYRLKVWHLSRDLGKRHCSSCLPVGVAVGLGTHPLRAWGNVETLWRIGTHEAGDLPAPSRSPPKSHFSALSISHPFAQRAYYRNSVCAFPLYDTCQTPGASGSLNKSTRVPPRSLVSSYETRQRSSFAYSPTSRDSHAQTIRLSHRKPATLPA